MDPLGNRLPFTPPLQPPAPNIREENNDYSIRLVSITSRLLFSQNTETIEFKRWIFNCFYSDMITVDGLFHLIRILKIKTNIPFCAVSRYLLSDFLIQCWAVILRHLEMFSLSKDDMASFFICLKLLMRAENFDFLWPKIENVIGKILKNNVDHGGDFVPDFLYDLAALHPQIRLQKDQEVFLFEFLRKRNQASGHYSIMYFFGIFAHFTDPN